MPLTLDEFNGMELLWSQLPKRPDENHVTLSDLDLEGMWYSGMVDTKQFSLATWKAAFDVHSQGSGVYIVSKEEFLMKEIYRYKGEIMIPFDAFLINEGKYTEDALKDLFSLSIAPSCSLEPSELNNFLEELKAGQKDASGMINIDKSAKNKIHDLLERYPSPLRRLELMFDAILKGMDEQGVSSLEYDNAQAASGQLSQQQLARAQVSSFSMQPSSATEERFKKLRSLEKKKDKKTAIASDPSTSLKKVKRSRKGMRG